MEVHTKSGHSRPGYVRHSRRSGSPPFSAQAFGGVTLNAPVLEEMITSELDGTMWRQAVEAPGSGITLAIR